MTHSEVVRNGNKNIGVDIKNVHQVREPTRLTDKQTDRLYGYTDTQTYSCTI